MKTLKADTGLSNLTRQTKRTDDSVKLGDREQTFVQWLQHVRSLHVKVFSHSSLIYLSAQLQIQLIMNAEPPGILRYSQPEKATRPSRIKVKSLKNAVIKNSHRIQMKRWLSKTPLRLLQSQRQGQSLFKWTAKRKIKKEEGPPIKVQI